MHVLLPTTSFFKWIWTFFVVCCNDYFLIRRLIQYSAWIGAQPNIHLIFLFDVLFTQYNSNWNDLSFFFCYTIIWLQNRVICFVRRRRNIRLIKEILEQWNTECGGARMYEWTKNVIGIFASYSRVDLYPTNIHLQFLKLRRGKKQLKKRNKTDVFDSLSKFSAMKTEF